MTSSTASSVFQFDSDGQLSLCCDLNDVKPYEGLQGLVQHTFKNPKHAGEILSEFEYSGNKQHLVVFRCVTVNAFDSLKKKLDNMHLRATFYAEQGLLIVKFPKEAHEIAHGALFKSVMFGLASLNNIMYATRIVNGGATTYELQNGVTKEADASFLLDDPARINSALPTIVIEAGYSEKIDRLRVDAAIWLSLSNNAVKAVIIIALSEDTTATTRTMTIEKWVLQPPAVQRPITRFNPTGFGPVPTRAQQITVVRSGQHANALQRTQNMISAYFAPAGIVQPAPATVSVFQIDDHWKYKVSGGHLILRNNEIFDGAANVPTGDVIIAPEGLAYMANQVLPRMT